MGGALTVHDVGGGVDGLIENRGALLSVVASPGGRHVFLEGLLGLDHRRHFLDENADSGFL